MGYIIHCQASGTQEYEKKTRLGYRVFRCHRCATMVNERIGTAFNNVQCPTDVVMLVVLWRIRYKLILRDLVKMFAVRGYRFTHEMVRDWEARFAPLLSEQLKAKRRGQAGSSWYTDEAYAKITDSGTTS